MFRKNILKWRGGGGGHNKMTLREYWDCGIKWRVELVITFYGGRGLWFLYFCFKLLIIFVKKLRLRCLIGSRAASDLGISSTCILNDYSAHLLEFFLFVCISNMVMIVCVHCGFLIWFSPMIFILHLKVLPRSFIKWGSGN